MLVCYVQLAHYEIRRSVQVPLFLKLGDSKTALHKAVESGDSNLIYDVLLKLRDSMPLSQFQVKYNNTYTLSNTLGGFKYKIMFSLVSDAGS